MRFIFNAESAELTESILEIKNPVTSASSAFKKTFAILRAL